MTETNSQTSPNDVPAASDVPAAAGGRRQGSVAVAVTVATVVVAAAATAVARSVTPNGKSAWCRSAASPKPSKAVRR